MSNGVCNACHVRLRPHIEQQVRRNDSIVQCDSCQRILYFQGPPGPQGSQGSS
jgi:predicted  nucleic acid-binding Zn-ribbon protein